MGHAPSIAMKYIAALLVAGGVYVMITHKAPLPAKAAGTADSSAHEDWLKSPIDRTHQVLDQAKTRAGDPALQ
jgi:hypothetical protein